MSHFRIKFLNLGLFWLYICSLGNYNIYRRSFSRKNWSWLITVKCDWLAPCRAIHSWIVFRFCFASNFSLLQTIANISLSRGCFELFSVVFRKHEVTRWLISGYKRFKKRQKRKSENSVIGEQLVCEICSWSWRCGSSPQLQLSLEEKEHIKISKGYQMIAYKKVRECFFLALKQ